MNLTNDMTWQNGRPLRLNGRSNGIRTHDLMIPNHARYQTALHSVIYRQLILLIALHSRLYYQPSSSSHDLRQ